MENRDFRDRLKNHTKEVNPNSWEQMESLLDTVDKAKPKKKKKRRGFWLFLFGLGLIGLTWLGMHLIGNDFSIDKLSQKNEVEDTTLEKINEDNNQQSFVQSQDTNNNDSDKELITDGQEVLIDETRNIESQQSVAELVENQSNTEQNSGESENNQNSELKTGELGSSSSNDPKLLTQELTQEIQNVNQVIQENRGQKFFSETDRNTDEKISLKETSESLKNTERSENEVRSEENDGIDGNLESSKEDPREAILSLETLKLAILGVSMKDKDMSRPIPEVKIVKPSRFNGFVGGGYALFNENPGFIVQGGVSYGVDRILDLEANIGYTYGSEQNITSGEKFTFERQFDFSFLIHLNLIKNHNHKLSFMTGIGYSFYSGERIIRSTPIGINTRKSRGRNFQGGIDYRFKIRKYNSIGLRVGLISYDDSVLYFSPRFIKEF